MKVQNLKPLNPFVFFFAHACERIFIKTHSFQSRYVIGLENIPFVGAAMHLSAREFLQAPAAKGLMATCTLLRCQNLQQVGSKAQRLFCYEFYVIIIVDCFYIALFSAVCALMLHVILKE